MHTHIAVFLRCVCNRHASPCITRGASMLDRPPTPPPRLPSLIPHVLLLLWHYDTCVPDLFCRRVAVRRPGRETTRGCNGRRSGRESRCVSDERVVGEPMLHCRGYPCWLLFINTSWLRETARPYGRPVDIPCNARYCEAFVSFGWYRPTNSALQLTE